MAVAVDSTVTFGTRTVEALANYEGAEFYNTYDNTTYVPVQQVWVTTDTISYRQMVQGKNGSMIEFDVYHDGSVKVERDAFIELLRAAGVIE